jgi:hypothetical protein
MNLSRPLAVAGDAEDRDDALFGLGYQPPASSFLSEQINHQQSANSTFLSEQTSTSHQPPADRTDCQIVELDLFVYCPIGLIHPSI